MTSESLDKPTTTTHGSGPVPADAAMDADTIQILAIRLRECEFHIDPEYVLDEVPLEVKYPFEMRRSFSPDGTHVSVTLGVSIFRDLERAPFKIRILFEGHFRVVEGTPVEGLRTYAKYNAIATLVPYVRETLASLTTRAAYLPLILPPVNVQALVDSEQIALNQ